MSEFNHLVDFWRTIDENGNKTWAVYVNRISILYYFNDENIKLECIISVLKQFAREQNLGQFGWKLPFRMQKSDVECLES